jgi:uncharacterized protein
MMLLRFEVSNHRSVKDPVELSFIATDEDRPAARSFDLLSEKVLAVAGIYGANASGKSNVVEALAWLSAAVGRSFRLWDEVIPRDPFRFSNGAVDPSTYEIEAMVDGVRFVYRLEVDDTNVLYESLHHYTTNKRSMLFVREGLDFQTGRGMTAAAGIRELIAPRTLALSSAMRLDHKAVAPFGRKLASTRFLGGQSSHPRAVRLPRGTNTPTEMWFEGIHATLFDDDSKNPSTKKDAALLMLRFADLGISDVKIVDEDGRRQVQLVHRASAEEIPFEMREESLGTQVWFRLIGPALSALTNGQVLLFDELDSSLHPSLTAHLVELFQNPDTNPNGAQLIFTSHDTSLLNHLNRDEIWLTEKGADGATKLIALAEFGLDKVRRSLNIERSYLQGRFGAVPTLDRWLVQEAIGLGVN